MADETSGSHVTWRTFLNACKSCAKSAATSQAAVQSYAAWQRLRLPRSKYICVHTTAFASDAIQMHWILERNVVSVCIALFKTENYGFCAQIVYVVDLLSFSRKNKMKRSHSEVHIRDRGNMRMGEHSRRHRRMEESSEKDQGPEGGVASWMDGRMCGSFCR